LGRRGFAIGVLDPDGGSEDEEEGQEEEGKCVGLSVPHVVLL
jgi:hypothetical protein